MAQQIAGRSISWQDINSVISPFIFIGIINGIQSLEWRSIRLFLVAAYQLFICSESTRQASCDVCQMPG